MEKQKHIFDELKVIFSQERLAAYFAHKDCCKSQNESLIVYSWNIELSKSLYPALQILEIALRNALHEALTENYQTVYWFDLPFLYRKEREQVNEAKENLWKQRKSIEVGRVVAELSFGFWTSLFDLRYEHNQILWPKLLKSIFPYLPKGQRTRSFLSCELNRIRRLRNRVFHYEPIWHWKNLPEQHSTLKYLISSLSISAARYLTTLDQFSEVYDGGRLEIKDKVEALFDVNESDESV